MTEAGRKVFLVFVASLWMLNASGADSEVSCVSNQSCILPCNFHIDQNDTTVGVHWSMEAAADIPVHSYDHSQDQLTNQDQRFRGRTSLFTAQIPSGDASLQLTRVEDQDQGRYQCHTSTNKGNTDSFINLTVRAPDGKIDLRSHGGAPGKGAVVAAIVAAAVLLVL